MAALPLNDFLAGIEARGLCLRADGDDLVLTGPAALRTDRIKNYMRAQKTPLLAHLRAVGAVGVQSHPATVSEAQEGEDDGFDPVLDADLIALGREVEADLQRQMAERGLSLFL